MKSFLLDFGCESLMQYYYSTWNPWVCIQLYWSIERTAQYNKFSVWLVLAQPTSYHRESGIPDRRPIDMPGISEGNSLFFPILACQMKINFLRNSFACLWHAKENEAKKRKGIDGDASGVTFTTLLILGCRYGLCIGTQERELFDLRLIWPTELGGK